MAQKVNLTQAFVANLEPPKVGRLIVLDGRTPGLQLMATDKGTKSFYLRRRIKGKSTRVLLGHHPLMSVEAARDAAAATYAEQLAGTDHNEDKRTERKAGMTLGSVWAKFETMRLKPRSSERTIQSHASRWKTCLEPWAAKRLDSIRREDVVALHAALGEQRGHTTANRAVQLLRALFNFADGSLGAKLANPAAKIELFRETPRERFLKADEVPKFFAALDAEPDEMLRDFFLLALFTGARRWNVLSAAWADIDLTAKTWTIPAMKFKTRRPMTVILSPEALEVLQRRHVARVNEFVFPSHGKRGHIVEPRAAWSRILDRCGLTDLKIHDLRRTLGSWQAAGGASLPIIGKSLGHTQAATTQIYARLQIDDVRASVELATAALKAASEEKSE